MEFKETSTWLSRKIIIVISFDWKRLLHSFHFSDLTWNLVYLSFPPMIVIRQKDMDPQEVIKQAGHSSQEELMDTKERIEEDGRVSYNSCLHGKHLSCLTSWTPIPSFSCPFCFRLPFCLCCTRKTMAYLDSNRCRNTFSFHALFQLVLCMLLTSPLFATASISSSSNSHLMGSNGVVKIGQSIFLLLIYALYCISLPGMWYMHHRLASALLLSCYYSIFSVSWLCWGWICLVGILFNLELSFCRDKRERDCLFSLPVFTNEGHHQRLEHLHVSFVDYRVLVDCRVSLVC